MDRGEHVSDGSVWSASVVITTFNHARFLAQAIASVYAQTMLPDEIIVVDDGSRDRPERVVRKFPQVKLVRQPNAGLSGARNTGLRLSRSRYIVFLDADDRLLPGAIEAGLATHRANAGSAFIYGGHRRIDASGRAIGRDHYSRQESAFRDLLLGNQVAMHGAAMFDRVILENSGGYDGSLRLCEDYDVYLRLARKYPVASHSTIVAEYRMHSRNASINQTRMLEAAIAVLKRHSVNLTPEQQRAAQEGEKNWREHYAARPNEVSPASGLRALPLMNVKQRAKRLIKSALAKAAIAIGARSKP